MSARPTWKGVLQIATLCAMMAGCEADVAVSSPPAEATPARFYIDGESQMDHFLTVWLIHDRQRPAACALVVKGWGNDLTVVPWVCE
jgi:hypothetical protein